MAKPAKSLLERKISLIDDQEYLSEKEKKKAKEEAEKTEKIKASKKEETRKILEEEQKEFEKAAEKSAALEEKKRYLSPRDSAKKEMRDSVARKAGVTEDVFEKIERDYYESRKKEEEKEEKRWENFGKEFENVLKESSDYVTEKQSQGKIVSPQKGYGSRDEWYSQSDDDFVARYNAAEDYVMSEGENAFENTVKGIFNRFRSAPGEAIEDVAYFLNDNIPEDAAGKAMRWIRSNAGDVAKKNIAGNIGNRATEHFNLARENTGVIGDKLIDVADAASTMLGYGTFFGPSNLALSQSIGGGVGEYRYQRENGADKSEALTRGGTKGVVSYLIERLGGLGADNSAVPKVNFSDVVSVTNAIFKTAAQEGGEEFAEYTVNNFIDSFSDAVYKGEVNINWDIAEALDSAATGALVGGILGTSQITNGRDVDIVEEMNKILTDSKDTNTRINNIKDLKKYLSNRPNAKKELDNLLFYLNNPKTKGVEEILRNGFEKPVIRVNHSTIYGAPKSITQKNNDKGGVVRNYYNLYGDQYKQIADNNENHKTNDLDIGGMHAHNYVLNENRVPEHKEVRKLSIKEILENGDLLWKYLN